MPPKYSTDDQRWEAVLRRDARADGHFVYAVVTTGIFCRPTCSARRPLRKNVRFYENSNDADAAGFRGCLKCHPDHEHENDSQTRLIREACKRIAVAEEEPSLADLANGAGLSPSHFHRLFKRITGVTPKGYAQALRRERMRGDLENGTSVTDSIHRAGYGSSSRFYEKSDESLGMTPTAYRAGGKSQRIRHATAKTSLGWLLVATTKRGICAVELGDTEKALRDRLKARFPRAEELRPDAAFRRLLRAVVKVIESGAVEHDLPLDILGTAFQQRVWEALRRIPRGETVTYSDLADAIGKPKAVRAVASACAANGIAVLIPCHRAVRRDGGLGGYRWGLGRKEELLRRESDEE